MTRLLDAPMPRLYYGWVTLTVAALAMVGTLPGRTQGLGLITEPLLRDLALDRLTFAQINLGATLIGSLFCLGIGRLVDRLGSRTALTAVSACLGIVVVAMSAASSIWLIALLITLTRGFGQSALSVASLAAVGKWFSRRLSSAMGVYAVVTSVGFMIAFPIVGAAAQSRGWRTVWLAIGIAILAGLVPLSGLFVRSTPEEVGLRIDGDASIESAAPEPAGGATVYDALRTPAFWVFALSGSLYGLIASGIALFNESILAERGFDPSTYHRSLVVTALTALAGNFMAGAYADRGSLRVVMTTAMVLLAGSLLALPYVTSEAHVVGYAVAMGVVGGFVMVVFFSFWGRAYGRGHLGRIQGVAQILTVLGSACGPLLLASVVQRTGSYAAAFHALAGVSMVLAACAAFVSIPTATDALTSPRRSRSHLHAGAR